MLWRFCTMDAGTLIVAALSAPCLVFHLFEQEEFTFLMNKLGTGGKFTPIYLQRGFEHVMATEKVQGFQ